jgi:hypothetical protein
MNEAKEKTAKGNATLLVIDKNGKVVSVLFLTEHHAMKAYWGSGSRAPRILDLGTRWRRVVSFTPGHFTARERASGIHWIGDWVGPRAGLDAVVRKIPNPYGDSNPRSSGP